MFAVGDAGEMWWWKEFAVGDTVFVREKGEEGN